MTTKQFFKQYPGAKGMWKAGDRLFLHSFEQQARDYARKMNATCEYISNAKTEVVATKEENIIADGAQ